MRNLIHIPMEELEEVQETAPRQRRPYKDHPDHKSMHRACPVEKCYYESEYLARMAIIVLNQRTRAELYPYQCPHCKGWHLTSSAQ